MTAEHVEMARAAVQQTAQDWWPWALAFVALTSAASELAGLVTRKLWCRCFGKID
jgi:hypothetical protein